MTQHEPEFSHVITTRSIPDQPIELQANLQERERLSERFGVTEIAKLEAQLSLGTKRNLEGAKGDLVTAKGHLHATVTQPCAVSGDPLTYTVEESLDLVFVPAGSFPEMDSEEEIEIDSSSPDEIEFEDESIDLGEAIAQSLGLAIDPYREGPQADRVRAEAGIESDEDRAPSGPLADALAAFKK